MTQDHYFTAEPKAASRPLRVRAVLPDRTLELVSDRGVFAHGHLDRGTEILLRTIPPPPAHGDILDLGCGYGPIAITVALRAPGARVWATDINRRARELTVRNAEAAGLSNVRVAAPEEIPAAMRFAAVYSNPPVRLGKQPLHELLETWLDRLEPDGIAYLVVQRHLGADTLAAWLAAQGCAVQRLRSRQGYRVLAARPAAANGHHGDRDAP